jgi:hypothetical protein
VGKNQARQDSSLSIFNSLEPGAADIFQYLQLIYRLLSPAGHRQKLNLVSGPCSDFGLFFLVAGIKRIAGIDDDRPRFVDCDR